MRACPARNKVPIRSAPALRTRQPPRRQLTRRPPPPLHRVRSPALVWAPAHGCVSMCPSVRACATPNRTPIGRACSLSRRQSPHRPLTRRPPLVRALQDLPPSEATIYQWLPRWKWRSRTARRRASASRGRLQPIRRPATTRTIDAAHASDQRPPPTSPMGSRLAWAHRSCSLEALLGRGCDATTAPGAALKSGGYGPVQYNTTSSTSISVRRCPPRPISNAQSSPIRRPA
jgi:hypothetical protein